AADAGRVPRRAGVAARRAGRRPRRAGRDLPGAGARAGPGTGGARGGRQHPAAHRAHARAAPVRRARGPAPRRGRRPRRRLRRRGRGAARRALRRPAGRGGRVAGQAGIMTGPAAPPPGQRPDPVGGRTDAPPRPAAPVALVTGAARGIGAATVAALAADGGRVVAAGRCADDRALPYPLGSRADLDRVAETAGGDVVAWVADARDPGALAAAVGEAERRWGGLDAAIAIAGVIAGGVPAWELPAEQAA